MTNIDYAGNSICTMQELVGCTINGINLGYIPTTCKTCADCNNYEILRFSTDKGSFTYIVCAEYDDRGFSGIIGVNNLLSHKVVETAPDPVYNNHGLEFTTDAGGAKVRYYGSEYYELWIQLMAENKVNKDLAWKDIVADWKY